MKNTEILLDTNFLVYCAKEKIDYNEEIRNLVKGKYELAVFSSIVNELQNINKNAKKYRDKKAAELALKLLSFNKIIIKKSSEEGTDEDIFKNSKGNYVATVDLDLANRLTFARGVIVVRGRKKLCFK